MLMTHAKTSQHGVRKRTVQRVVHVGPLSLRFITIIMFTAVALFYLAQSTQSATKRYTVRELELKKEDMQKDKERLSIEATRLQSLQEIQGSVEKLGLQPSGQ
ncbi:hypothetical protein COS66_02425 [Candidatus Berkelbacteria bacterium CG06_land_8_20_14_3_00_43_10]|uniref:Cell division protein FtsL n=1 Tax=Candidatus Berkelbacteria bacterium CG10_big_fil_rev_8_21_14_0_10_43_14 TaxID=1974515 RepID=A0A2M6R9I9_9BACT|nr:MAG: hypothetical protein AUK41_02695 [Candidatus Berkelbacteria bacterium CG2_30_43_20]PIS07215.1 MAG: hypothetical protein COT79_00520 [Candidatus Berkelbacteria bacterium CG10_big_fil_rev_8_21_14_0_10_43_14]PIU87162.1 MAG: hypothetical protein COS66_02425 [Candidatus Berkelbacteria bacterium CG06_land_8_20_14_3_00_43_10]